MAVLVNDEKIDPAEIEQEMERLRPYYDQYVRENNPDGGDEQLTEWARENIIERTLIKQAAVADPEAIPAEQIDEMFEQVKENLDEGVTEQQVRADIETHMRISRLLEQISEQAGEPSDEDLQEYYKGNEQQFTSPEQVRASHIVKHIDGQTTHEDALKAIQDVKAELDGGKDFEELASEHSDCPDQAGDLGYFPRGQMVPEFEDVAFKMEVGDVSEPFLTAFGYHIAKLQDKQPEQVVPFEQVKDNIQQELTEQLRRKVMEDYVDGLKGKATIEEADD